MTKKILLHAPLLIVPLFLIYPDFAARYGFYPLAYMFSAIPFSTAYPLTEILLCILALTVILLTTTAFIPRLPRKYKKSALLFVPRTLLILSAIYAALWLPMYRYHTFEPPAPAPSVETLTATAARLIEDTEPLLATLPIPDAESSCEIAAATLQTVHPPYLPVIRVSRIPNLLSSIGAAGIFVPFTFEALVNPAEPAWSIPFTALHEGMHAFGIANEGQANIIAYELSETTGGALLCSANLHALRQIFSLLEDVAPLASFTLRATLSPSLTHLLYEMNAFTPRPVSTPTHIQTTLYSNGLQNYDALTLHLTAKQEEREENEGRTRGPRFS